MNRAFSWKKLPIFPCFIRANREAAPGRVGSATRLCVLAAAPLSRRPLGVASAALSGTRFLIDFIFIGFRESNVLHYFPFTVDHQN